MSGLSFPYAPDRPYVPPASYGSGAAPQSYAGAPPQSYAGAPPQSYHGGQVVAQYGSGPAPQAYAGAPPQSYAAPYGSGAPLPAGWQELYTQDGRNAVYYFNTQTRETSWTRPSAPSHADIFQQPAPMGAPQSYAGAPPQAYGGAHQVQYGYGVPPQSYAGAPAQSYSGATVAAQYGSGPAAQAYPAAGYPHQPELLSQTSRSQGMLKAAALSVAGTRPTVCRKLGTRPLTRTFTHSVTSPHSYAAPHQASVRHVQL